MIFCIISTDFEKERVELLRHSWMDESNVLNDYSDLHGSCSPILMILNRMKGLCGVVVFSSSHPHAVAGFQLWMCGLKNDSTDDRTTSPLEEQDFGVIPLVPLFTISFQ
jgi:hypothetical protein